MQEAIHNFWGFDAASTILQAALEHYAAYAGYSSFKNDTFYMPADGRSAYVTLGYAF